MLFRTNLIAQILHSDALFNWILDLTPVAPEHHKYLSVPEIDDATDFIFKAMLISISIKKIFNTEKLQAKAWKVVCVEVERVEVGLISAPIDGGTVRQVLDWLSLSSLLPDQGGE